MSKTSINTFINFEESCQGKIIILPAPGRGFLKVKKKRVVYASVKGSGACYPQNPQCQMPDKFEIQHLWANSTEQDGFHSRASEIIARRFYLLFQH